ncbi:hypothetical protein DX933_14010 [Ornithinibacillus gellani]|uniref:hypothetical protein n=1 Tax=Ornithinibacillus gellani TaxID=2293253 RepID=UPI000F4977CD|nr:hypothetical protein [Ornithinibacillus gellani]TQS72095.1 hypothetical protein DX933_14010 [Ornithinibacillus gellani]
MYRHFIVLGVAVFIFLTVKQLIFNDYIQWLDNIGISVLFILISVIWEWSKKPYQWKKEKD